MDAALEDKICELYDIFIDVRFWATNTYCEICVLCNKPYWTMFAMAVGLGWQCRSTDQKVVCWGSSNFLNHIRNIGLEDLLGLLSCVFWPRTKT
jgi:hypothetical protein